jgi:hypothetical protein
LQDQHSEGVTKNLLRFFVVAIGSEDHNARERIIDTHV